MRTLTELLDAWDDNSLGAEGTADLKRRLAEPDARAELVSDWLLHGAIYELLREERSVGESVPAAGRPAGVSRPLPLVRSRRSPWFAGAIAAGAAAAVLLGWFTFQHRPPVRGTVTAVPPPDPRPVAGALTLADGEVWIATAGLTNAVTLAGGPATLRVGDAILTGSNALARFTYPDGSTLSLYRNTRVVVSVTNGALRANLALGAIDADIRPQLPGCSMHVTTAFMGTEVLGTEFRLMADSKSAWLGVRNGSVDVVRLSDGKTLHLGTSNYAAVHPKWPYMRMNALVCPAWKSVCQRAAGSEYP
jgi:ferric-dicitrate binding protein FerR (iron transport regulator)